MTVEIPWKPQGPPGNVVYTDANSRSNVRPATGVPDYRAANREKEDTLTILIGHTVDFFTSKKSIIAKRVRQIK